MAYTKVHDPWHNADSATGGGDTSTPIRAADLDHIEQGIQDAAATADTANTTANTKASLGMILVLGG